VFRRKGKDSDRDDSESEVSEIDPVSETDDIDATEAETAAEHEGAVVVAEAESGGQPAGVSLVSGPYDEAEAPEDEIPRVDLGSLRVPLVEGLEVRLDMDEQTGAPSQLVLADGESMLQLGVFAAPRSSGIWDEVRAEIVESLKGAGGACEEVEGPLGTELTATIPTGEAGTFAPARFIGVDRPRWFLRGLLSGPAAIDRAIAAKLEFALQGTVVVRGKDAMPIRDPLALRLPPEAAEAAAQQAAEEEGGGPTLDQLEQGPTITETR
jgi:Protein of unknown function (DUF3710)